MPYMRIYKSGGTKLEIAPLIEEIKWSENDLDSPNAGRTLDGKMHRGKVTSKRRADIKFIDCKPTVLNSVFAILRNEYFYCETDLAPASSALTMEMYNSVRSAGVRIVNTDGVVMYGDAAANIIER